MKTIFMILLVLLGIKPFAQDITGNYFLYNPMLIEGDMEFSFDFDESVPNIPVNFRPASGWSLPYLEVTACGYKKIEVLYPLCGCGNEFMLGNILQQVDTPCVSPYNTSFQDSLFNSLLTPNTELVYQTEILPNGVEKIFIKANGYGTYSYFQITSEFLSERSSSINEEVKIFFNPVKNNLIVTEELKNIIISDFSGRIVLQKNNPTKEIELSHLPKGNYILSGQTKTGKNFSQKFIKE